MAIDSKLLEKARAAVQKKNYEYAIECFLQHIKAQPSDVDARKELRAAERAQKKLKGGGGGFFAKVGTKKLEVQAMTIGVSKDPEKAMLSCEDLLKQDPDVVAVLLKLGEAASHANQNHVAVYTFEDALSIDKENKEAWRLLGRVYRATEELEKALKCFQRLQKLDPKDKEAEDMAKNIPAQMTAKKVKEGVDKGGFQNLIDKDKAASLERQSQRVRTPEQALERISELEPEAKKNPKDVKTMRLIAELYLKAEQPDNALVWCERALAADPKDFLSSELKGDLTLKKMEDVEHQLEEVLKTSQNPQVRERLQRAHGERLRFEVEEFKRRCASHPTEYGLRYRLGQALLELGQIDEAIPELQKAKADPRKKAEAGKSLGMCFVQKKIWKMALNEFNAAREDLVEMDDLKKEITYNIARIYEAAKKSTEAIAEYQKIAEVDFNYRDVTKRMEGMS